LAITDVDYTANDITRSVTYLLPCDETKPKQQAVNTGEHVRSYKVNNLGSVYMSGIGHIIPVTPRREPDV